jgi:hypothetical protein
MINKIETYPESKIVENNAQNIIGSNDDGIITEAESPYYAEFHEEVVDNDSLGHEFYIYTRGNDVRMMSGWCEYQENIDNIKFIVDAMNEKSFNDSLAIVGENWAKNKKWSNSTVRKSIYEQLGESNYSSDTEHGD